MCSPVTKDIFHLSNLKGMQMGLLMAFNFQLMEWLIFGSKRKRYNVKIWRKRNEVVNEKCNENIKR